MYKIKANDQETINRQNKIATIGVIGISCVLAVLYGIGLFTVMTSISLKTYDISIFIRIFSVVLACIAVISCILCYMSNNKDEVFIISLMYMVFIVDIALGNFDSMVLTDSVININSYITISTSLIRISILMILILPFNKTRKIIMNNKLKSSIFVVLLSLIISLLRSKEIMFLGIQTRKDFILYNGFLILVYVIFSSRFIIKSIKQREYIYSVISASIFFFAIKAAYAIVGSIYPLVNIKIISLSITYMGFIVFIGGVLAELALSIKRNKELKDEINIFYKLVDESKDSCTVILNELGNVKYANKTGELYLREVLNIDLFRIEDESIKYKNNIDSGLRTEIKESLEINGLWKGNIYLEEEDVTIDCFIQNICDYDGNINTACIFKDISQKLRTEKRLIEYEKMKNHEKIKNEFFANISHELRTPLNIFYSTIQLLDLKSREPNSNFNEIYNRHKQCLKTNCQRMLRLINNIVDITKIDVGFTTPKFVNCDIVALVEDITLSVINYANPKDIKIIFDTEMEEYKIKCDPAMIERAMLNLLSNAIKFTKENGNILVSMYYDKDWVHIRVKDNGIGIPIEMQCIIFDRFVQGDRSLTRLNEGSGIGLSIVKSIVELNEGEIYLESDEENGTEFEIILPNRILLDDKIDEELIYEVDMQKIELELSDIYKLYE